jgi:hypothetical protein
LSTSLDDREDVYVSKEEMTGPPDDETLDELLEEAANKNVKPQAWMYDPSSLDVDYVQRRRPEEQPRHIMSLKEDHERKLHKNELNHMLKDLEDAALAGLKDESPTHDVNYEFGDAGSSWRMTKLKGVYRRAEETGRSVNDVALETYGDLRDFDDAREEEIELDRRKMYGEDYVGKIKPSGDLFAERQLKMGIHRPSHTYREKESSPPSGQGEVVAELPSSNKIVALDQTALNRLRAKWMKAKMRNAPEAAQLEAEYNSAMATAANKADPEVVVLNAMENRMLVGGRKGEVKAITNKRGRERGLVEENEDMSIEDMVRQERRSKGQRSEGLALAERIAKDGKFTDDLEYMDDNAAKLAKHVPKSALNLRTLAIEDFKRTERILETCPLCHHEDRADPSPVAPIVSLATRTYLTLPTEPEITPGGAVIVPIQHHTNLLEADDDEWEELRNFMKALTRMYQAQNRAVVFYENAAAPKVRRHAALVVVPLPLKFGDTALAFFREAMLASDEEWSQHRKIIDTLEKARNGLGKAAFRRSLVKEMPYFHVWFTLDGGLGHVVEDERRWPKGDLFAREVVGGMVDADPAVIKRQGKWHRNDARVGGFRKDWTKWDWTRVLMEG